MHSLMEAIGFGDLNGLEDESKLIDLAVLNPSKKDVIKISEKRSDFEMFSPVAKDTGIIIRGEYNEKGQTIVGNYFPAHISKTVSMKENLMISKRMDSDAFTVICDDTRLGLLMIFYLQNKIEMFKNQVNPNTEKPYAVRLTGLSNHGKILLPIENAFVPEKVGVGSNFDTRVVPEEKEQQKVDDMVDFLYRGIDRSDIVAKRIQKEDVYSIIDTTLSPCGAESDNYMVIGYIRTVESQINEYSHEEIYILGVRCNGVDFEVCISKKDLMGEPLPGRRFKGNVWMQGYVEWRNEND